MPGERRSGAVPPPPAPVPADWYPDPDAPKALQRYWDGEEWTEWTDVAFDRHKAKSRQSRNDTLVVIGYITGIIFPIVGLIIGIVVGSRGDQRGTYVVLTAIVGFILNVALITAL